MDSEKIQIEECKMGVINGIFNKSIDAIEETINNGYTGDSYTFYTNIFYELICDNKSEDAEWFMKWVFCKDYNRLFGVIDILLSRIYDNNLLHLLTTNNWIFECGFSGIHDYNFYERIYKDKQLIISILEICIDHDIPVKNFIIGTIMKCNNFVEDIMNILICRDKHSQVIDVLYEWYANTQDYNPKFKRVTYESMTKILKCLLKNNIEPNTLFIRVALANTTDTNMLEILVDHGIEFNKYGDSIVCANKKYCELVGKSGITFENFLNLTH